LVVTQIPFQVLGERVLPLGLGSVIVRGCNPEGFEFEELVLIENLVGHGVHGQHRGE